jgi:phosphoethanolamine N-methyltransferase
VGAAGKETQHAGGFGDGVGGVGGLAEDVVVDDATSKFIEILHDEVRRLKEQRTDFVGAFSEEDLNYIIDRWLMKVRFCEAGDMKWGIYLGTKA